MALISSVNSPKKVPQVCEEVDICEEGNVYHQEQLEERNNDFNNTNNTIDSFMQGVTNPDFYLTWAGLSALGGIWGELRYLKAAEHMRTHEIGVGTTIVSVGNRIMQSGLELEKYLVELGLPESAAKALVPELEGLSSSATRVKKLWSCNWSPTFAKIDRMFLK